MSAVGDTAGEEFERSDAELIAAVRAGDNGAYATLWSRHEGSARRLARQIARPADADELVSESFYRVLRAINGGGGPDGAFRPYLLSTLRRVNIDTGRSYYQRVNLTDEDADLEAEPAESAADVAMAHDEDSAAWRAWASLPESSRTLLWHLLVEEESPAQIAPILGTTPNGVASRAVRAKERLRQAFLQQHLRTAESEQCAWTRQRLGEYVRKALSKRSEAAVEAHLKGCARCKGAAAYLTNVNQALRAVVVPVVLGGAAIGAKYLAAGGASHAAGVVWLGRLRPRGKSASITAGGAVAASIVAVALVAFALSAGEDQQHDARPVAVAPNTAPPAHAAPAPAAATEPSVTPSTRRRTSSPPPSTHPAPSPTTRSSTRAAPAPRTTSSSSPVHSSSPAPPPSSPRSTPATHPKPPPTSPKPSSSSPTPTRTQTPTPMPTPGLPTSTVPLTVDDYPWLGIQVSNGWTIESVSGRTDPQCAKLNPQEWACLSNSPGPYTYTIAVTAGEGTTSGKLEGFYTSVFQDPDITVPLPYGS